MVIGVAGTKEEEAPRRRTFERSKPHRPGLAAPSAGVKRRETHTRDHGRLSRRLTRRRRAQLDGYDVVPRGTTTVNVGYGGSSPPVSKTARSQGPSSSRPNRSTHARTASIIASTASPRPLPAGVTAVGSGSSATIHRVAHPDRLPARLRAARSQPRTVPSGRPSCLAIGRCPTPAAARRSASPITAAASRRRGTVHAGASTCVASHAAQRARRGVSRRTSCAIRTSRARANPHGDNRPEQPGHASSPAASAACTPSGVIEVESIEGRGFAHGRRTLSDRVAAGKGRLVLHIYHTPLKRLPPACRAITTVNGAKVPFHAHLERRLTET
jgi:hypothetical protein